MILKKSITLLLLILLSKLVFSDLFVKDEQYDKIRNRFLNNIRKDSVDEIIGGLRNTKNYDQKIPLKILDYKVDIENNIANVQITQLYKNDFQQNIESEYFFAINPEAAFYSLQAEVKGVNLIGEVKEQEQAKKEYEEAIQNGQQAIYAEVIQEAHDIMKLNVGNLEPGEQVKVRLKYYLTLDIVMNKLWKFQIGNIFSNRSISGSVSEDFYKAASYPQIDKPAYFMYIKITLKAQSPIYFMDSPSHDVDIKYENEKKVAFLTLKKCKTPDTYFVLLYQENQIFFPQIRLEKFCSCMKYVAQVTFVPNFQDEMNAKQIFTSYKQAFVSGEVFQEDIYLQKDDLKGEFVFIIDRSGSMQGQPIEITKKVLIDLLYLLPPNSYYNIISFGGTHESMYHDYVMNSQDSINESVGNINKFIANLGGTNILDPLSEALQYQSKQYYSQNVFLLTDGQVQNHDEVIKHITHTVNQQNSRVYSIGLGSGVSQSLIRESALLGQGKFVFIPDVDNEKLLRDKLVYLVKDSFSYSYQQFSLQVVNTHLRMIVDNPEQKQSIRKNEPLTFALFYDKLDPQVIKLSGYDPRSKGIQHFDIFISQNMIDSIEQDDKLHILWSHKFTRRTLLNAAYGLNNFFFGCDVYRIQNKIWWDYLVDLSVEYQVLSELTAFILVTENQVTLQNPDQILEITVPHYQDPDKVKTHTLSVDDDADDDDDDCGLRNTQCEEKRNRSYYYQFSR